MEYSNKNIVTLLLASFVLMFFGLIYTVYSNPFNIKQSSYDFMLKLYPDKKKASDEIVLVIVDDKSLAEIGRWPWSRKYYNDIFQYINNYTDAKLVAFDAIIAAKNVENPEDDIIFFNGVKNYDKLTVGVAFSEKDFSFGYQEKVLYNLMLDSKHDLKINDKRTKKDASDYLSFTQFPYTYFKNAKSIGAVNLLKDNDGKIRKIQQLVSYNNVLYPSMELVLYSKYTGIKDFTLTDKYLTGKNEKYELKVPITKAKGNIASNLFFYETKDKIYSHKVISAADIIKSLREVKKGKKPLIDNEILKDKVVFVGANANAQYAQDEVRTPISDLFSGTDLRATSFNNLLSNDFYVIVSKFTDLIIGVVFLLLLLLCIYLFPITTALILIITISCIYLILAAYLYSKHIAFNTFLSLVFIPPSLIIGYTYRFLLEGLKKAQIEKTMGKFISKDVMQNVIQNIETVGLGGKRANISVLFADIRGFTTISEALSAEEVSVILNEYFSAIVPIIESHKGVLNKFVGDAVLAIFGEPIQNENHALDAVRCGWSMLNKVKELQEKWIEEGKPKIEIGIGISTGDAFVGNIGSEERFEYTVIGDTVNTASRIENFNKIYKTKFLISQTTFDAVQKHVDVLKIRDVNIRGKVNKVNIYEVLRYLG